MLDFLSTPQISEVLNWTDCITVLVASIIFGFIVSIVYVLTHRQSGYSGGFAITIVMLTATISMIILLIGSNVARAFSLAGAFSLIRFRSAPGDPKDIAYVFFALGNGLACGMGFIGYAGLFCVAMCIVLILIYVFRYPDFSGKNMILKIVIPEDVDYEGLFEDAFKEYTNGHRFIRVKTVDFGTLFQVEYNVSIKRNVSNKEFIDKIRCLNNNLRVVLSSVDAD